MKNNTNKYLISGEAKKNKVIFVVPSLTGGGAERVAATLCESLGISNPDLEILLVLFERARPLPFPNVRIECLDLKARGNTLYATVKFFRVIWKLARIFRQEAPCTILSFMDYTNIVTIIGNRLAGGMNRTVLSVHTKPTAQTGEHAADMRERTVGFLIGRFYNMADAVVAVSGDIMEDLASNFKVTRERILVIPNPADLEKIVRLSDEEPAEDIFSDGVPVVLSVGRLSKEKGHDTLLRAFALVREKTPARLVILGGGIEDSNLKQLIRSLGIDGDTVFSGYRENPYAYMKRGTVFVLPSVYEGFGLVLVEAMACGVPVVSTRSYRGIVDIVEHEKNGLLTEVGDEKGMAEAILRLLESKGLRRQFASAAQEMSKQFAVEPIAQKYLTILIPSFREPN